MTYAIPQVRTNYGTFNRRFQSAKGWNDISDDMKRLPMNIFKKNLLTLILLEKYIYVIYRAGGPYGKKLCPRS